MANKHPPFVQKMIYVTLLYSCQIGVVKIERLSPKRVSAEACKAQQLATDQLAPRANTWMAPVTELRISNRNIISMADRTHGCMPRAASGIDEVAGAGDAEAA